MSTRVQVQELARPFVERNDDLALVGREIVVLPVHHFVRSIYIDRTSIKGLISPFWRVTVLFAPPSSTTGWGADLPAHGQYIGSPDTAEAFEREADRCLAEILRPVCSIEALRALPPLSFARRELTELQDCLITLAAGHFDRVTEQLARFIPAERETLQGNRTFVDANFRHGKRPWTRMMRPVLAGEERLVHLEKLLALLMSGDRQSIADLLRQWERHNAMADRVHDLWKPAPFPFE